MQTTNETLPKRTIRLRDGSHGEPDQAAMLPLRPVSLTLNVLTFGKILTK